MKRLFTFLTAMVLMVSTAIAQVPDTPERSTAIGLRGRNIKTVNNMRLQQRHDQRPVKNVVPLAAEEEAITVPFTHTLGKNESETNTALYSFVDANNDEKSWKIGGFTGYSVCMKPATADIDKMDDWLMSPGIKLEAGKTYTISFEMRYILSSGKKDSLDVHIGTAKEVAAMGETPLFTATATSKDFDVKTGTLTVEADGVYYIGFHAVSLKEESGNMGLCNFSMTAESPEIEKIDPPAAGVVEYEVFPQGQLKAHVKYTAPTKTVTGADLTKIDKVLIVNRWYEKFEYMDVAPGQVIELDVDLFSGKANNRIQATAYLLNSQGEYVAGEEVLVTGIMAGYDYPQSPQNVKAVVSADRKTVTLTWDAVGEVGEDGGYVPTDELKYYIFDAFGSYYDPAIAETKETSYVFDYSALTEQDFFAYQVTASYVDPDGYDMSSLATNSNIITAGPAFELPFKESFSDARFQHVWVYNPESSSSVMAGTVEDNYLQTNADDPDAEPEYINSQDGDNGFFYFMPVNKDDMLGMCSQAVALPQTANPLALDFYAQGKGSVIDV
ncbi:MAG: choice-of-anchor J domain-containing protein, partial [Bacteroidaceae bacterium]|nr:choice-of-anchor J domain-containing protein [Bacteroidaceae bacterium]